MAEQNTRGRRTGSGQPRKRNGSSLYAAVDLGTNNCRLLVATPRRGGFSVVDSYSQVARLGEGLARTGRLSDAAIERAMAALKTISARLKSRKVGHVRCIATEACRKAENGAEFIARVREETGLTFKIIGAHEEARLALIGCHNLIEADAKHVLVFDVGGGSTELSLVDASRAGKGGLGALIQKAPIKAWTSLPIGVVTLSEAFSHLPEAEAYPAMVAHARGLIENWRGAELVRRAFETGQAHVIGTSGTVTCLAGVHLGLERYRRDLVDGTWMSEGESRAVMERLNAAGPDGRAEFPTIGRDRADLMPAGCAIVEATWSLVPGARMRIADRGLREGLLLSMMRGSKKSSRGRRSRRSAAGTAKQTAGAANG